MVHIWLKNQAIIQHVLYDSYFVFSQYWILLHLCLVVYLENYLPKVSSNEDVETFHTFPHSFVLFLWWAFNISWDKM